MVNHLQKLAWNVAKILHHHSSTPSLTNTTVRNFFAHKKLIFNLQIQYSLGLSRQLFFFLSRFVEICQCTNIPNNIGNNYKILIIIFKFYQTIFSKYIYTQKKCPQSSINEEKCYFKSDKV